MKNAIYLLGVCLLISSCDKPQTARTYTEVTEVSSQQAKAHFDDMISPHADSSSSEIMPNASDMPGMANTDPHAGYTKEELTKMLQETMPDHSVATVSPIQWIVPKGWIEKPGNGMRLATFLLASDPQAIDCSIVTLGAGAGGIEANIVRWLGQINIPALSEQDLKVFISQEDKIKLKNGYLAETFDFTLLQNDQSADTPSMLASIIDTPSQRVFVKMTGNKAQVQKNKTAFIALVNSLDIR